MFTIAPASLLFRASRQAREQYQAPSRITEVISRQRRASIDSIGSTARRAAQLTRISSFPKCLMACSTIRRTAASSETSARMASPPISAATASTSPLEDLAFTATKAPASASARAIARPMLRPAPVTNATRPWSSLLTERRQVDARVEGALRESEERLGALRRPAAVGAIEPELLLDVGAGERLPGAAAHVRLALLERTAVLQLHAHVPGEFVGIGIVRFDLVAHLRRQRAQALVAHALLGEGVEAGVAEDEAGGDAVGLAELGEVGVRRALLVGQRLPQAVHDALGRLADHFRDVLQPHLLRQAPRAVDIGLGHGAAGVGLEGDRGGDPALTEAVEQLRPVAVGAARERVVEAVRAFHHRARADEAVAGEIGGADAGLGRPARMQALGPR